MSYWYQYRFKYNNVKNGPKKDDVICERSLTLYLTLKTVLCANITNKGNHNSFPNSHIGGSSDVAQCGSEAGLDAGPQPTTQCPAWMQ